MYFIKIKIRLLILASFFLVGQYLSAQDVFIGTTMGFTDYLENNCGIVFMENNLPSDPFVSLADHGASTARFRIDLPPYSNSYSQGIEVDYRSVANVQTGLERAKDAGLNTLLTFSYTSFALEDVQKLNPYVAPLSWQPIADDLEKLKDSVYTHTYSILNSYCSQGLVPAMVSIANESTWHMMMPNIPEDQLPEYDPQRSVALLNAGAQAVRDMAELHETEILVSFHMSTPATTKWWMEEHWPYYPDCDIMGLSLYYGWYNDDYAGYASLGDYITGLSQIYDIKFLVMETAQLFRTGGNDNHVDILGTENIPPGYINPPTTETQKEYLTDITREVLDNGGLGTIAWGGEWVACDCYIYADPWGKGSSWENKAFWDFDLNFHAGTQWMQTIRDEYMADINHQPFALDFTVYPNPVRNNVLYVHNIKQKEITVLITDLAGKRVFTKRLGRMPEPHELSIPHLKSGVYLLSIQSADTKPQVFKIILSN